MSGEWFYSRPLVRREGVPSLAEHNLTEIDKHLKDSKHPLRLLRKSASQKLLEYYQLFLDVNKQTIETQANITIKDKEQSYVKSRVQSIIDRNQSMFIKQSFL